MRVEVEIQGVTPLLMSKFNGEDLISSSRDKNATPREEADRSAYKLEDGTLYLPGTMIFSSIISAGVFSKLGKNKVTTMKTSLIPAGITMVTTECFLGTKDYEVDSQSVVIPATGGRVMKHRPRLDEWKTNFVIDVDTGMFSEKMTRQIIDDAGMKCGVGAFRPNRKGPYGKFKVVKWNVKK